MFERSDGGVWRTLTVQQIDLWRDVLGHACLDCGSKSQQGSALQTFVGAEPKSEFTPDRSGHAVLHRL